MIGTVGRKTVANSPRRRARTKRPTAWAKKSGVVGEHGDALKIRLAAPPVDGKANAALIEFLATRLGVARAQVTLKSGQTSRRKVLEIEGAPADLVARLTPEP